MLDKIFSKGTAIWLICALFFLYEFFLRTVIGTYQVSLMHDLELSAVQFALISSTFFLIVYGLMQIPVGLIVDHMGLKKSLMLASVACAISTFGFSYSENFITASIFRMLMGFGASFGFICLLVSVYEWMPSKYRAIFIGLSQFIGTIGPMLAAGPLSSLSIEHGVSWNNIFIALSVIGVVLSVVSLFFVENNKEIKAGFIILHKPETVLNSFKRLFKKIQPWYIATVSAVIYFPIEYLSENEGRIFLNLKGINIEDASYMITTSWIGFAIFCPLFGLISDWLDRRKLFLVLTSGITFFAMLLLIYAENSYLLFFSFFLIGVGASGQVIGFVNISENFKKQFTAISLALNNAVIITFAAIMPPILGFFIEHISDVVTIQTYQTIFMVIVVFAALAFAISFFFIKETFAKSTSEFTILKIEK